jgi:conjugative transfer pilus assembly protein TraH
MGIEVRMRVRVFILSFSLMFNCYGGVGDKTLAAFNKLGMRTNYTEMGAYRSQSGGYYGGGSFVMRSPSHQVSLGHMQMPGIATNACDVSLVSGGFSFISKADLVNSLKGIATGALTYGFLLAMQTMVPAVSGVMKGLRHLQNWANKASADACWVGRQAMKGAILSNDATRKYLCKTRYETGIDLASLSSNDCINEDKLRETNQVYNKNPAMKKIAMGSNFNVAWLAIKNHPYFSTQADEIKHFYMSLTGTLVVKDSDKKNEAPISRIYPTILKPDLVKALMEGGKAKVYTCKDSDRCLNVTEASTIDIPKEKSMKGMATKMLTELYEAIKADKKLGESKMQKIVGFLNGTRLPILKMMYVNVAATNGNAPLHAGKYAEWIAYDILYDYLMGIIDGLINSAKNLKRVQFNEETFKEFQNNLQQVKDRVIRDRAELYRKYGFHSRAIEETRLMEQRMAADIDIGGN